MVKKTVLFFFFITAYVYNAQAQVFTPLNSDPSRKAAVKQADTNAQMRLNGMGLPFFDDFSKSEGNPDPAKWEQTGGALISNRFAKDPISRNVATLDGLDANGIAYNFLKTRETDSLISKTIDLNGQQSANVVLSFYWQAGGLAFYPPGNSTPSFPYYLKLEFKKQNGSWQEVWIQHGNGQSSPFTQQLIAITDPDYFHADFQFRFIARGEKGMKNSWNIDYVKLDRNRTTSDTNHNDVAISHSLNSILNGYTAIPAFEFSQNPSAKLGNTVSTTYNNLMVSPLLISAYGYSQLLDPASVADTFYSKRTIAAPTGFQYPLSGTPSVTVSQLGAAHYVLKYSIFLKTNSPNQSLLYNDTVSRVLTFSDHFAYDDSTAETGINISPPQSGFKSVATSFEVSKPAIIRAVRIYFTSTQSGTQAFNLKIWGDNGGVPAASTLLQQGIPIPADSNRNKFIEVPLTNPVQVTGKFYVGWSQFSASGLTNIGFDLNNNAPGTIFYSEFASNWGPLVDNQGNQLQGAIMIRPVVDEVVGLEEDLTASQISIYPNPATDKVQITGKYDHLILHDISGKRIAAATWNETQGTLNLPNVSAGVYFLKVQTQHSSKTHKLIITK